MSSIRGAGLRGEDAVAIYFESKGYIVCRNCWVYSSQGKVTSVKCNCKDQNFQDRITNSLKGKNWFVYKGQHQNQYEIDLLAAYSTFTGYNVYVVEVKDWQKRSVSCNEFCQFYCKAKHFIDGLGNLVSKHYILFALAGDSNIAGCRCDGKTIFIESSDTISTINPKITLYNLNSR
ncbi:MAG: hypothetical protein RXR08_10500 [Sulfolobaceae archaeon]